ncbi:MAG: hypothetical protein OSJ39_02175 [Clostridia bacterium]|nr:hypothetical protein [Clostridia bacterium]
MTINKVDEQERKRAKFCTERCPHPDELCKRSYCEEFQKEFGLAKFSKRKKKK